MTQPVIRVVMMAIASVTALLAVSALRSTDMGTPQAPELSTLIPENIGDWSLSPLTSVVRPSEDIEEPGTAVLYRTYVHKSGQFLTLVVAYGSARGDAVRLHQPEVCYRAQGYAVSRNNDQSNLANGLRISHMAADSSLRRESVSYWIRVGDKLANGQAGQQFANIQAGLGKSADSTLVRVSTAGTGSRLNFAQHNRFINDLLSSVPRDTQRLLAGDAYMTGKGG